ncbi:MAG: YcgN family cysteine cluster protein [Rhodobacteraceae bacterium]|jgi:uncharacterized cysteine cluster protein YcgN (CxxCxxCC family)|nr:YcgN family cysteine cluster protein [Paracoccaceae bacterium]
MSDPIDRSGLAPRFWERKPLKKMSPKEWEALCDGCGKCCLNKIEDAETGEVALTRIACRLLDDETCKCAHYEMRRKFVPDCLSLTINTIQDHMYWLPQTCAYRLLAEKKPLPDWHPLITGDPDSVHYAGISMQGMTCSEMDVHEDDWEDYIIEEPQ